MKVNSNSIKPTIDDFYDINSEHNSMFKDVDKYSFTKEVFAKEMSYNSYCDITERDKYLDDKDGYLLLYVVNGQLVNSWRSKRSFEKLYSKEE